MLPFWDICFWNFLTFSIIWLCRKCYVFWYLCWFLGIKLSFIPQWGQNLNEIFVWTFGNYVWRNIQMQLQNPFWSYCDFRLKILDVSPQVSNVYSFWKKYLRLLSQADRILVVERDWDNPGLETLLSINLNVYLAVHNGRGQ